jgi:flagellar hook-basal body complex protein FliE
MRVEPLVPDIPRTENASTDVAGFARALDAIGGALMSANQAEDNFAYGRATLQEAVYERAQADVALAVASSTATRITQAVQSILNLQV